MARNRGMNLRRIKLSDSNVVKLECWKTSTDHKSIVNTISYSPDGTVSISSSDSTVVLVKNDGQTLHTIDNKKYGANHICFSNKQDLVLHASVKVNDDVRLLSVINQSFIRYFRGHTGRVTSLSLGGDTNSSLFVSASLDRTVRLWDLNSDANCCTKQLEFAERPVCCFDPEGLVVAVAYGTTLNQYDIRMIEKPFLSKKYPFDANNQWRSISFCNTGKQILVNTDGNQLRLINAFNGHMRTLVGFENENRDATCATITNEGNYAYSASSDGYIYAWKVGDHQSTASEIRPLGRMRSNHGLGYIPRLTYNPKYLMMISAHSCLHYWRPSDRML